MLIIVLFYESLIKLKIYGRSLFSPFLIVNIIVNGVNLGLTFRNQFQALAIEHNEDIEEVTNNWISNAEI